MRILIVEDERALCDTLVKSLKQKGYEVDACYDGDSALDWLLTEKYDLLLLDLNLPGRDGMDLLKTLREQDRETRVLILSARSRISDKVEGLDCGANDYLVKPFHLEELEARVRSLTRRSFVQHDAVLRCGELSFDTVKRTAQVRGEVVALTRKENGILEYLLLNQGRPVSQEELMEHVWDGSVNSFSNSIRVHISSLRKKLKAALGYDPILNRIGEGYLMGGRESERFSGEFVVELSGAKHSFCIRGWYIALAVTALGGAVAYFVSGKALKPLKRFTAKAERVQLQSLTEITLSEDEAVEFSRLSRAINQMLLRLNQAFDAQQQFVGNAAHELRTPLALMQARLDLYMATDHGDNRPETAETISMLREQTERLSKMVRTLLDMSDLKAVPRTDKIQLAPMIEEVLADLSPLAEKSGVALSQSGEDLWITGSDVLVYRSIFNLVENGVKYNHPGGSVRVAASRRGSSAVIEVRDTGCGIPENFRESVFQPFFRVDKSRSREKGGVGLGLSLVWEIAHLHGGSVRITESGKDGTVIELTLPISAEEQGIPCR